LATSSAFAPTALKMTEGEGGLYCDVVGWGDSHYDGAASINSLIPCHVERRDARIIASRSRNIPRMLVVTTQIQAFSPDCHAKIVSVRNGSNCNFCWQDLGEQLGREMRFGGSL
jgi:hypothetical protein